MTISEKFLSASSCLRVLVAIKKQPVKHYKVSQSKNISERNS
jgi:hypothetical protein